jgi:hypothetical protein
MIISQKEEEKKQKKQDLSRLNNSLYEKGRIISRIININFLQKYLSKMKIYLILFPNLNSYKESTYKNIKSRKKEKNNQELIRYQKTI